MLIGEGHIPYSEYISAFKRIKKCFYCNIVVTKTYRNIPTRLTIDHIIPKSMGGNNSKYNKVICCLKCNRAKGSMSAQEFKDL